MPTDTSHAATSPSAAAILAAALLMALAWTGWSMVQQVRLAPSTVPPTVVATVKSAHADPAQRQRATALAAGPRWTELSAAQRRVLEPLAERWSMMDALQKRRWMALADGYDKLSEKEQEKLRDRMQTWSSLSTQQRSQARLNFALTNRLATDKRAQWEAYQALSDEEKRLLAARAAPRIKGAAPAIQPAPSKRLTRIPAASQGMGMLNPPKIPPAAILHLPMPAPTAESAPVRMPALVETAPIAAPSAKPIPLPPMDATHDGEEAAQGSGADIHLDNNTYTPAP